MWWFRHIIKPCFKLSAISIWWYLSGRERSRQSYNLFWKIELFQLEPFIMSVISLSLLTQEHLSKKKSRVFIIHSVYFAALVPIRKRYYYERPSKWVLFCVSSLTELKHHWLYYCHIGQSNRVEKINHISAHSATYPWLFLAWNSSMQRTFNRFGFTLTKCIFGE